jgi:hypothetical protein
VTDTFPPPFWLRVWVLGDVSIWGQCRNCKPTWPDSSF